MSEIFKPLSSRFTDDDLSLPLEQLASEKRAMLPGEIALYWELLDRNGDPEETVEWCQFGDPPEENIKPGLRISRVERLRSRLTRWDYENDPAYRARDYAKELDSKIELRRLLALKPAHDAPFESQAAYSDLEAKTNKEGGDPEEWLVKARGDYLESSETAPPRIPRPGQELKARTRMDTVAEEMTELLNRHHQKTGEYPYSWQSFWEWIVLNEDQLARSGFAVKVIHSHAEIWIADREMSRDLFAKRFKELIATA